MKLFTAADGFGDSVVAPSWYPQFFKWPEIIKLMTKGVELENLSRYGAGNEYIVQCIRNAKPADVALVQWAAPNRLDLILAHRSSFWTEQIAADATYNNNVLALNNDYYWLSSGSQLPGIKEYHQKFISMRQHQRRSQLFVEHAKLLFSSQGVNYRFLLTSDSDYLQETVADFGNWCWHEPFKGMDSFRKVSKFSELDFDLHQPISLIQFDFIKQFIIPNIDLQWRSTKEIDAVENMLHRKYKEAVIEKNK